LEDIKVEIAEALLALMIAAVVAALELEETDSKDIIMEETEMVAQHT
jgi:hypothetical protein